MLINPKYYVRINYHILAVKIMKNTKKETIIESIVTTVLMGLLVYAAYSLWYIFYGKDSGPDVHLYTGLSGLALGWFFLLFVQNVFKKSGWIKMLIAFIAGNALLHGMIWGINEKINPDATDNVNVIINTFSVVFALSAILLLASFIIRAKSGYKALNLILAIVYFIVSIGAFCVLNKENIKAIEYKRNVKFDTVTAEEMYVTDSEKSFALSGMKKSFLP